MKEEFSESMKNTLADAESAHCSVDALVEILNGCPPDYPVSARSFVTLIGGVKMHLDNVVDGLRVASIH